MALESLQAAPPAPANLPRLTYPYRLRFRKADALRLVSHIDLLHVFERMLRRAAIPFASTQGFHPKPCLVFAHALALGIAGLNEVVEMDLTEPWSAAELLDRLNRQAPAGLVFLNARALEGKSSTQVRRAFYRLPLPAPDADLPRRCAALLARKRCLVERVKPRPRRIDIKPYFGDIGADAAELTMNFWVTPHGGARPEEVVKALGLGHLLDAGAVLERTHLEMMDELPEAERWLPEIPRLADVVADPGDDVVPAALERPEPVGQPLLANPLSFET